MNGAKVPAGYRWLAMVMIVLAGAGCAMPIPLGDVMTTPRRGSVGRGVGQVGGEVMSVDTRRREVRVVSGWNQVSRIRYDNGTRVRYGSRQFSVRELRRGDLIRVWVRERGRDRYATRIELIARERDRRGRGRVEVPRYAPCPVDHVTLDATLERRRLTSASGHDSRECEPMHALYHGVSSTEPPADERSGKEWEKEVVADRA